VERRRRPAASGAREPHRERGALRGEASVELLRSDACVEPEVTRLPSLRVRWMWSSGAKRVSRAKRRAASLVGEVRRRALQSWVTWRSFGARSGPRARRRAEVVPRFFTCVARSRHGGQQAEDPRRGRREALERAETQESSGLRSWGDSRPVRTDSREEQGSEAGEAQSGEWARGERPRATGTERVPRHA
jgi:hypothetical protein